MIERRQDAIEDFNSYRRLIERDWERLDKLEENDNDIAQRMAILETEVRNKAIIFATVISAAAGLLTTLVNNLIK